MYLHIAAVWLGVAAVWATLAVITGYWWLWVPAAAHAVQSFVAYMQYREERHTKGGNK